MANLRRKTALLAVVASLATTLSLIAIQSTPATAAGVLRRVTGAPLNDVVVDATGRAYATNRTRNQVEVISLATGALEAPIFVGSQPAGLDISPDQKTLYVTNWGAHDVSVVDLALRQEVRRITLVPEQFADDHPVDIAVANNGTALVATTDDNTGFDSRMLIVNVATGAVVRKVTDSWARGMMRPRVQASGDRSRIGVVTGNTHLLYTVATDTFSPERNVDSGRFIALDATGSKMLDSGSSLLDAQLKLRSTIAGENGRGVAMNAAGTIGYRARQSSVEVIDLNRGLVTATIALPEAVGDASGSLALSTDGGSAAVVTPSGLSIVRLADAVPVPACTRPSTPAGVVGICGAPLEDVVVAPNGRIYASNPARNQIEVVQLSTGALQAPIPVGSQPRGLSLSVDGGMLYVANSGADELSVVNLALGLETGRITMPSPPGSSSDTPASVAVAANGKALVTTRGFGDRVMRVDLATSSTEVLAWRHWSGGLVKPSANHQHIAVLRWGAVDVYHSATDTLEGYDPATGRLGYTGLGLGTVIAVDNAGAHIVVDGAVETHETFVLDGDLIPRATLPSLANGVAISPAGTTAYRITPTAVEVIDVARGLVTASAPLADRADAPVTMSALSPDGSKLVVLTQKGLTIVPLGSAAPTAPCTSTVTAICGAPLADIVLGDGYAFATNPSRNQLEVLSLSTGTLEAPILVGSRPQGLDLSPDGSKLYVANWGGSDVSVVDVRLGRETGRITIPIQRDSYDDAPHQVAVGANGDAVVITSSHRGGATGLFRIDLLEQSVRAPFGFSFRPRYLARSADHSHVALAESISGGAVAVYDSVTQTVGPVNHLGWDINQSVFLRFLAVDNAGTTVLAGPGPTGTFVLDAQAEIVRTVPGGGWALAINGAGTIAYRVAAWSVEVLDLATGRVTTTLPMADVGIEPGRLALTPDGALLAVLTYRGIAIGATVPKAEQVPTTRWVQPVQGGYDGIGSWLGVANDPTAAAGQGHAQWLYGHVFHFDNGGIGSLSLITDPRGKYAALTIIEANGQHQAAAIPFNWQAGRYYFPFVYRMSPGVWAAWVYDHTAGQWVGIGELRLTATWGRLLPTSETTALWFGATRNSCSAYPRADILFFPPTGYRGATPDYANRVEQTAGAGDCPADLSIFGGHWARYRLGADALGAP